MSDSDDIYAMADENSNIDTESVVSPRDFFKKLNRQSAEMASRTGGPGGLPPKPKLKPSDLKKTQGGLRPLVEAAPAKKSPTTAVKEDNRKLSNTNSESGNQTVNELTRKLEARRKVSEGGDTDKNNVEGSNSIAEGLALGLLEFEKKRSLKNSYAISDSNKAPGVVRPVKVTQPKSPVEVTPSKPPVEVTPSKPPVEVAQPKPLDVSKRPPAPLPKKVSLPTGKPSLPSPKKESPPQVHPKIENPPLSPQPISPTVKQDTNNNLSIEVNKRKNDYKFEIITHKGCKYLAYKLPLVVASKPRTPFRSADIVLPPKHSERSTPATGRISFIEPTASDEEDEDVKPNAPLPPPPVKIKGLTVHSTADDDDAELYDDTAGGDEEDEELYEAFDEDELKQIKEKQIKEKQEAEEKAKAEKLEKQRQKDEKKKAKEQKRLEKEKKKKQKEEQERQKMKEKEEQERQKMKEKYKLDGSERVLFSGKAKEKVSRNLFETLFEKGDDIPVIRTDESVNPKGKWLVQLKDGKFEYVDIRLVETEQPAVNGAGDDDENIYEDQESAIEEEDIYEDL